VIAHTLDVSSLPAGQQVGAWTAGVSSLFPGVEFVRPPVAPVGGAARGYRLGDAQLWVIESPDQVLRLKSGAVVGMEDTVSVVVQVAGYSVLRVSDAQIRIEPDSLYFADAYRPFEITFGGGCKQVLLHLARHMVPVRHPHFRSFAGALDQQDPGVQLLKSAILVAARLAPRMSVLQGGIALASIVLLVGAPATAKTGDDIRSWRTRRALADIDCGFRDPELGATRIAKAQSISRRRLDAIVTSETGKSITAHIWERRLVQAARDLADASRTRQQIADIAYSLGFGQAAHFCRAFKRRYHSTPSAWRDHDETHEAKSGSH
jgi:AraC family transcriptional regulator, positive regulator of tynA and feaB